MLCHCFYKSLAFFIIHYFILRWQCNGEHCLTCCYNLSHKCSLVIDWGGERGLWRYRWMINDEGTSWTEVDSSNSSSKWQHNFQVSGGSRHVSKEEGEQLKYTAMVERVNWIYNMLQWEEFAMGVVWQALSKLLSLAHRFYLSNFEILWWTDGLNVPLRSEKNSHTS